MGPVKEKSHLGMTEVLSKPQKDPGVTSQSKYKHNSFLTDNQIKWKMGTGTACHCLEHDGVPRRCQIRNSVARFTNTLLWG